MVKENRARTLVVRYLMFTVGLAVMAYAVIMTIKANFGVAPWEVLHIGLQKTFGLTIGIWSQLIGVLIILLTFVLGKIKPGIGTILNMVIFGVFIDLFIWLGVVPDVSGLIGRSLMFIGGVLVLAIGIGMYISPRLGAGPRDSFMLALNERLGWSIQRARVGIEMSVLIAGALLGGPVSVGTFVIAVFTGPLIQRTIPFWYGVMARSYRWLVKEQVDM